MSDLQRNIDLGPAELVAHRTRSLGSESASMVAVLGMHRSGTSGLAELLGNNGLDLGATDALMPATDFNPHGHFEISEISEFNESLLQLSDAAWWAPPTLETVQGEVEDHVPEARRFWRNVSKGFGGIATPLVKDPRLSLLLPIWRQVLPSNTLFILCVRDPLSVARSLYARDTMELRVGLALWEMYNISALRGVMGSRALFVDVDQLSVSADYRSELVSSVRTAVGLATTADLTDTFDRTLLGRKSSALELDQYLTVSQLSLYQSLLQLPHDVVEVDDLRHLQVPAATLRTIGRNRKVAVEHSAQLANLQAAEDRSNDLEKQLSQLTSELSEAQAQIVAVGEPNLTDSEAVRHEVQLAALETENGVLRQSLAASETRWFDDATRWNATREALNDTLELQRQERSRDETLKSALIQDLSIEVHKLAASLHQHLTSLPIQGEPLVSQLEQIGTAVQSLLKDLSSAESDLTELRALNEGGRNLEESRSSQLEVELSHVLDAHDELERQHVTLRDDSDQRLSQIEKLQAELSHALHAHDELERQHVTLRDDSDQRLLQIEQLRAELSHMHSLCAAAFASRSWRWTRFFRRERESQPNSISAARAPHNVLALPASEADRYSGAGRTTLVQEQVNARRMSAQDHDHTTKKRVADVAVVAHVFYPDLWEDLVLQLSNLQMPFDLYVSLTEGQSDHLISTVVDRYPTAVVDVRPNRGRDIAPFLAFIASGQLSGYRAILKLHTKRSHHRVDGEDWRKALWHGLLPSPELSLTFVDRLSNDPDVGSVVPRGNVMRQEHLGSNVAHMTKLLARIGIDFRESDVEFAAGSMYWLDGEVIELLRSLNIDPIDDFEPEEGQIDGTTAHALERLMGVLIKRRGQRIAYSEDVAEESTTPEWLLRRRPRVLAFYLPQFHSIPENDAWWGEGFTEWVNVDAAKPWHHGQVFPRLPAEPLGRYDLKSRQVMATQARMAQQFGIDGFLVYHYWFSGKRVLETPMNSVLADPDLNFPYALVWANENWTRAWDGLERDVLISQDYEAGWEDTLVDSLAPHLNDPRYIRLDNRPLVVIFKPSLLPDLPGSAARIREIALARGLGPIHLAGVLHDRHVEGIGENISILDSWIEFPPLSGPTPIDVTDQLVEPASSRGRIYSYPALVDEMKFTGILQGRRVHPGVMPSWDNTPRRQEGASSFAGANAADFRRWLIATRRDLAGLSAPGEMLVCINAWNEWAETAYLEPDLQYGLANLEAVHSAFGETTS